MCRSYLCRNSLKQLPSKEYFCAQSQGLTLLQLQGSQFPFCKGRELVAAGLQASIISYDNSRNTKYSASISFFALLFFKSNFCLGRTL